MVALIVTWMLQTTSTPAENKAEPSLQLCASTSTSLSVHLLGLHASQRRGSDGWYLQERAFLRWKTVKPINKSVSAQNAVEGQWLLGS